MWFNNLALLGALTSLSILGNNVAMADHFNTRRVVALDNRDLQQGSDTANVETFAQRRTKKGKKKIKKKSPPKSPSAPKKSKKHPTVAPTTVKPTPQVCPTPGPYVPPANCALTCSDAFAPLKAAIDAALASPAVDNIVTVNAFICNGKTINWRNSGQVTWSPISSDEKLNFNLACCGAGCVIDGTGITDNLPMFFFPSGATEASFSGIKFQNINGFSQGAIVNVFSGAAIVKIDHCEVTGVTSTVSDNVRQAVLSVSLVIYLLLVLTNVFIVML